MDLKKVDIKAKTNPNWFFNIREIDPAHQDYDETDAHQHNFYQFLFFDKATGKHTIDEKTYQLENNTIHFLSPNHIHHLEIDKDTTGFVCMFKEELFYINNENNKFLDEIDLFSNWNKNPVIQLNKNQFEELKNILRSLVLEYENQKLRKNEVLLMFLKIFLIKASRLGQNSNQIVTDAKKRMLSSFLGLLEEHLTNNLHVQFYAKELAISPTYLNRIIKETYACSISDFMNERLILEAKRILRFSSKSVKEIAYELGFDDPSYFSRFFKKQVHSTPIQYRNNVTK